MRNALIFSPGFDGHRQVYIFVIVHVLRELGFNIYIAGNTQQKVYNSFYIDKLKEASGIRFIDTSKIAEGGRDITVKEFLNLQDKIKAHLTIFPEADFHLNLLASQSLRKKNKLRGRTVGIFMRPFYYYREKLLLNKLKFLKHLPSRWKKDEELFYEFFLKRFFLLDTLLSIDENFVDHHPKFKWLPDVFQQYAETIVKPDEKSSQMVWIDRLKTFKEKNKDRFAFLYFGTAQYRRGYDILLKLAEETGGCFIHCGLRDNDAQFPYDTKEIISTLKKEGRFFETNEYIENPVCIEYFFKSASHLILPYRNFYGSSGVMLQALQYGIPVLAPDIGVIRYRIKKYHLGLTYQLSIKDSLKLELNTFKETDPKIFENNIKYYMNFQSVEQLKTVLANSFVSSKENFTSQILPQL